MDALSPDRGFHVTIMLADSAQVADGKLYVLGGGWTETGPQPCPFAIAGIIEVPWRLANQPHSFRLELIDLDGNPVGIPTPEGEQPFVMEGQFEVGRPPGARPGASLPVVLALNSGPVPLPPGRHLEWRLMIDDQAHDDWRLAFKTRPADGLAEAA